MAEPRLGIMGAENLPPGSVAGSSGVTEVVARERRAWGSRCQGSHHGGAAGRSSGIEEVTMSVKSCLVEVKGQEGGRSQPRPLTQPCSGSPSPPLPAQHPLCFLLQTSSLSAPLLCSVLAAVCPVLPVSGSAGLPFSRHLLTPRGTLAPAPDLCRLTPQHAFLFPTPFPPGEAPAVAGWGGQGTAGGLVHGLGANLEGGGAARKRC